MPVFRVNGRLIVLSASRDEKARSRRSRRRCLDGCLLIRQRYILTL